MAITRVLYDGRREVNLISCARISGDENSCAVYEGREVSRSSSERLSGGKKIVRRV